MPTPPDPTLLSTVAQISFTITGLMFVVVAADNETRSFWYGRKARASYANLHFLIMALPGFVALGALIQLGQNIALWPYTTCVLGLLSVWLARIAGQSISDLGELEEYRRLGMRVGDIRWQAVLYGGLLLVFGAGGFTTGWANLAFGVIEVLLVLFLLLSVANIGLLLRARQGTDSPEQKRPTQPESQRAPSGAWRIAMKIQARIFVTLVGVIAIVLISWVVYIRYNNAQLIVTAIGTAAVVLTLIVYYLQLDAMHGQLQIAREQLSETKHQFEQQIAQLVEQNIALRRSSTYDILTRLVLEYRSPEMFLAVGELRNFARKYTHDLVQNYDEVRKDEDTAVAKKTGKAQIDATRGTLHYQRRLVSQFYQLLSGLHEAGHIPDEILYATWGKGDLLIIPQVLIPIETHIQKQHGAENRATLDRLQKLYDDSLVKGGEQ